MPPAAGTEGQGGPWPPGGSSRAPPCLPVPPGAAQRPLAPSLGKLICLRWIWVSTPSNCFLIETQR